MVGDMYRHSAKRIFDNIKNGLIYKKHRRNIKRVGPVGETTEVNVEQKRNVRPQKGVRNNIVEAYRREEPVYQNIVELERNSRQVLDNQEEIYLKGNYLGRTVRRRIKSEGDKEFDLFS